MLNAGVEPGAYGETLLTVAAQRATRLGAPYVALAIARKSSLEGRLLAILDRKRSRRGLTRGALVGGLLLCGIVAVSMASVRLEAKQLASGGVDSTLEETARQEEAPKVAVIEFSGQLEARHETSGHLLEEWPVSGVSVLSNHSTGLSHAGPAGVLSIEIQGTLNDKEIDVSGNVHVRQRSGIGREGTLFVRLERPFEATLKAGEENQEIDLGHDDEGRIVVLNLTPRVAEPAAAARWIFSEIGRLTDSMDRHMRLATVERAEKHARALVLAAEGMVAWERTRRLADSLERLVAAVEAEETEEIERLFENIDRAGTAIGEDLEVWAKMNEEAEPAEADPAEAVSSPAVAAEESDEKQTIRITVLGEVNQPGAYEMREGSTVLDALGEAGGWTEMARLDRVVVLRTEERYMVDIQGMIRAGVPMKLEDGDVIVLQENSK